MKRNLIALTLAVFAFGATKVLAAPYGMAGCGLGALALGDQPGKIQILAATLNNLVSPQTSAITSGTSNCYEGSSQQQASLFIAVNQEALKNDISRAGGETLSGLSQILQCADSDRLGATLQQNYGKIFNEANGSAEQVSRSIDESIRSDEKLVKSCGIYS